MKTGFLNSLAVLLAMTVPAAGQTSLPSEFPSYPPTPVVRTSQVAAAPLQPANVPNLQPASPPPDGMMRQGFCSCDCYENVCGPPGRVWFGAEYLLWWIKDSHFPPLVTAGPPGMGAGLNRPGVITLFGGEVDNEGRSGGRFTAGVWLDEEQTLGLEGSYLFLGARAVGFTAGGPDAAGVPTIGRPFFDVNRGGENAQLIQVANVLSGTVHVAFSSRL
jgi:hypothetical protein